MNTVQPIRDPDLVHAIANDLKANNERDYVMYQIGINTGLRISDILKLRVRDIHKKTHIIIRATKTGKETMIFINSTLKKAVEDYVNNYKLDLSNYLIQNKYKKHKNISRVQAYKILNKVSKKYKLFNIGTHTLRKTFGYHFYMQTKDVALLQKILGHDNEKDTLRYIGIIQDTIDDHIKKFKI